ncbi:MAG: hypothetical protein ABFC56_13175 [Clostridiaceae bacterium]
MNSLRGAAKGSGTGPAQFCLRFHCGAGARGSRTLSGEWSVSNGSSPGSACVITAFASEYSPMPNLHSPRGRNS